MKRGAFIAITGLLGGVFLHVAGILAFPLFAGRDLWTDVADYGPTEVFNLIPQAEPGEDSLATLDPNMVHAVCRLDLTRPHRIFAAFAARFWSVGILDRTGRNLYSLNSATAGRADLDVLLIQPADLTPLRRNPPPVLEQSVVVDLTIDEAIVVIRAFAPDASARALLAGELARANCDAPVDLSPAAPAQVAPPPAEAP